MDLFDEKYFATLVKQAEEVQEKLKKMQDNLSHFDVEGRSGADLVIVSMTCKYKINSIKIDPSLMQEDASVLEDLLAIAFNDAVSRVESSVQNHVSELSKDIMPGGMPDLGDLPEVIAGPKAKD